MWTVFRTKCSGRDAFLAFVLALALWPSVGWTTPFHGSLYTPVREGRAIGPMPGEPPAYYPYEPREIQRMTALPSSIRLGLLAHVKARVGDAFFRRLHFAGGQFVDVAELHRINPASRRFRGEIPPYRLHFDFELPEVGIRHYTASISLAADGAVLSELDLPAFADEPGKLTLKPLSVIAAKLIRQGKVDPATATATITYSRPGDRLIWHFEQAIPGRGAEINVRTVEVDAHTGKILRDS